MHHVGSAELPTGAVFSQLGKMFSTAPLSDSESSDEEAEYVEYIYKPRQYFMASLCNVSCGPAPLARCDLNKTIGIYSIARWICAAGSPCRAEAVAWSTTAACSTCGTIRSTASCATACASWWSVMVGGCGRFLERGNSEAYFQGTIPSISAATLVPNSFARIALCAYVSWSRP